MRSILVALSLAAAASTAAAAGEFTLSSKDLARGVAAPQVANVFGCTGGNVSPDLSWQGVPDGTRSFVLTVFDPDAPTGSGWWHWVLVDIPGDATSLAEGAGSDVAKLPQGAREMRTDAGTPGYLGPCPPPGPAHRYVFTLTALKVAKLDVPDDATAAFVGYLTGANALGKAELTVTYGQ